MSKSTFKILAEALTFGRIGDVKVSTDRLTQRKLTVDEIKEIIREAFGKAKETSDTKAKELKKGWGDAELENEIDWASKLNIKEYFDVSEAEEPEEEEEEESEEKEEE